MYYHYVVEWPHLIAAHSATAPLHHINPLSLHQCTNFPMSAIVTSTIKPSKHKKPAA